MHCYDLLRCRMTSASPQMPSELILFGIVLAASIAVARAVKVRRTKQRIYYSSSVAGFLLMLISSLGFIGQFMFSFALIIILGVFSCAMLPRKLKTREKELMKEIQEKDMSHLTVRDLFSDVLWLKLIAKWGPWKSLSLGNLTFLACIVGVLWAMSQFYTFFTPTFVIVNAVTFSSLSTILLYAQIRKVADQLPH